MLQPKNIKKQKSKIWKEFSIIDFIIAIVLFFSAGLMGFMIPPEGTQGWIKIIISVVLFLIFSTLLAKSNKHNARLYVLLLRMIIFWFRSKKYGKETSTSLLIPYDEIIQSNIIKTKPLKDGVKFLSIVKFNGKSPWAEDENDAKFFLDKYVSLLDSVEFHVSLIRTKELLNYDENFQSITKNREEKFQYLEKIDASEEVLDNWSLYYDYLENDFNSLNSNLYVDNYYLVVYDSTISGLSKTLENTIRHLNSMDLEADILSDLNLINLLGHLNHKKIDQQKAKEYIRQQKIKYTTRGNKIISDAVIHDDFASRFHNWVIKLFKKNKENQIQNNNKKDTNKINLDELIKSDNVIFKSNHFIKDNKYYSIQMLSDLPLQLQEAWAIPVFDNNSQIIWNMGVFSENEQALLLDRTNKKLEENNLMIKSKYKSKSNSIQIEALEYLENQLQVNGNNLFNSWLMIVNEANNIKELKKIEQNNYMIAKKHKIILNPLPFKQFEAYAQATLIPSINLDEAIQMTSYNIAYGWPFENERNNDGNTIILGETINTNEPIIFNQFYKKSSRRVNYNMFTLGSSGKGKSTDVKKAILGNLSENNIVYVIDVQDEYKKLGQLFNAVNIDLGSGYGTIINPLQIRVLLNNNEEEYSANLIVNKHNEWLEQFFKLVNSDFNQDQLIIIMKAVRDLYEDLGIYDFKSIEEFRSFDYPIISDLIKQLKNFKYYDDYEKDWKQNMVKSTIDRLEFLFEHNGKYQFLYNGKTNINLENDFVIFNTQKLFINGDTDSGKVGLFVLLSYIQNKVYSNYIYNKNNNTVIVIDELHMYIDHSNMTSLNFVYTMTKTVRKFNAGMILCTQNPSDFLGSSSLSRKAEAVLQNCQYAKFFGLRQQDLEAVVQMYKASGGLNSSHTRFLADSEIGTMLFSMHMYNKMKMQVYYNEFEENLFFTKGRIGSEWDGSNE